MAPSPQHSSMSRCADFQFYPFRARHRAEVSEDTERVLNRSISNTATDAIRVAGCSRFGAEEVVEPVDEAWRRSDEIPGTARDQPLGIEDCGERVADPLQPWSVTARGHQRGDARVPY